MIPLVLLILVPLISAKHLPSNITLCRRSDPDFNGCMKKNVIDGVSKLSGGYKELGIIKSEPFFIKSMDLGEGGSGPVSLKQHYENMEIFGMTTNCVVDFIETDFNGDNCYWRMDVLTPLIRMKADYTLTGQILVLPVNGKGKAVITFKNMKVRHDMRCEKYKKKDKIYYRIVSYTFDTNPEKAEFDLENIVEGSEQISNELSKTINENWKTVYNDVKPGIETALAQIYKDVVNKVFSKVSEQELFLD